MKFYNEISSFYDNMFPFQKRKEMQRKIFQAFNEKYPIKRAVEAGCGTGVQSLALNECGISVCGIDASSEMIHQARENALKYNADVDFHQSYFKDIAQYVSEVDAVFCLGNSIAHVTDPIEIKNTLNAFYSVTKDKGFIILQLLNYIPIIKNKQRILGIDRQKSQEFIRFYDFLEDGKLQFNILHVVQKEDKWEHTLHSQLLYPYVKQEIVETLTESGYSILQICEELDLQDFDEDTSPVISVIAQKV